VPLHLLHKISPPHAGGDKGEGDDLLIDPYPRPPSKEEGNIFKKFQIYLAKEVYYGSSPDEVE
jgi:hypothetical protein